MLRGKLQHPTTSTRSEIVRISRAGAKALGARLREIRRDAGLTARAFASAADWHYTKVSKLENGARPPSQADIRDWCRLCSADDQVTDLIAAARNIEISYAEWRRQLRAGMRRAQAARLPPYERTRLFRLYEPALVPGIFQTAQYAATVIRSFLAIHAGRHRPERGCRGADGVAEDHLRGPEFRVILEEQALRTRVGGPEVMTGQLDRLLAVMSLPSVSLAIIPLGAKRKIMPSGGFLIFDDEIVQAETVSAELNVTEPHEIALYTRRFEFLRQSAVTGREARGLIHRALGDAGLLFSVKIGQHRCSRFLLSVASSLRPRVVATGQGRPKGRSAAPCWWKRPSGRNDSCHPRPADGWPNRCHAVLARASSAHSWARDHWRRRHDDGRVRRP